MRVFALVFASMLVAVGCDPGPECGRATVEVAGLCLPAGPSPTVCGPNTRWDGASQTCVGVSKTRCGEGTYAVVDPDTGHTVCTADPYAEEWTD